MAKGGIEMPAKQKKKNGEAINTVTAQDVTDLMLYWANRDGDLISNLKLQKLLYYAQAWHLVNFDVPLFGDSIEAWDFGPVIPNVYRQYK